MEACDHEFFTARCPFSQHLLITKALYGHIGIGRCVGVDLGYFGCYADVQGIVSERCNGKQRCEIAIPDVEIATTKTCVRGIAMYLDASYACIPGLYFKPFLLYYCNSIFAAKECS